MFLFYSNVRCNELYQFIRTHIDSDLSLDYIARPTAARVIHREKAPDDAARVIQRGYRNYVLKKNFSTNPYLTYLSLVNPNHDHFQLSCVMFGRHEAELSIYSSERMHNPYIYSNAAYHRDDLLSGELLDGILSQFGLFAQDNMDFDFVPITQSYQVSIQAFLKQHHKEPGQDYFWYKNNQCPIGILAIPKAVNALTQLHQMISAIGLVATPWEIGIHTTKPQRTFHRVPGIHLNIYLPKTKQALLASNIMNSVHAVSKNSRYSTRYLAQALSTLLQEMPNLEEDAIQRISYILDMTHCFYANHYIKYAFCVYVVVHEFALYQAHLQDKEEMDTEFNHFIKESRETLFHILDIEPNSLTTCEFVAAPALSGTNAYAIATSLAANMNVESGKRPLTHIFYPNYYEINFVAQNEATSDADIFLISTGPIVNQEGLIPGVDINRLVKTQVIDTNRTKPLTIIIDATSTLYQHLKLTRDTRQFLESGLLSILIFESHQKFGLLHTDQVQYGRMFGLVSKLNFKSDIVTTLFHNAALDFASHPDMRVGAFIHSRCADVLEKIKIQHFKNGAHLRNLLTRTALLSDPVNEHELMLNDPSTLYFVSSTQETFSKKSHLIMDCRESFGHFSNTYTTFHGQTRIACDAADRIDNLIFCSKVYLTFQFTILEQHKIMLTAEKHYRQREIELKSPYNLDLADQIFLIALLSNIITRCHHQLALIDTYTLSICWLDLKVILPRLSRLVGRQHYISLTNGLIQAEMEMERRNIRPVCKALFIDTLQLCRGLHALNWDKFVVHLARSPSLGQLICESQHLFLTQPMLLEAMGSSQYQRILFQYIHQFSSLKDFFFALHENGQVRSLSSIITLLQCPAIRDAVQQLMTRHFIVRDENIKMMEDRKDVALLGTNFSFFVTPRVLPGVARELPIIGTVSNISIGVNPSAS